MKISIKIPKSGLKNTKNSNKIAIFRTDASHVCMSYLMCHEYLMCSKGENHAKEETWTFRRTNAPTVGPDVKYMGSKMRLQHAKG